MRPAMQPDTRPSWLPSPSGLTGPAPQRDRPRRVVTADAVQPLHDAPASHLPIDRVLECMAGFYQHEADGREAMRHLRLSLGLLPSQLVLLRPTDAGNRRFARLARRWAAGQHPSGPANGGLRWLLAGSSALLGGLLAGLLAGPGQLDARHVLTMLLASGLGAAAGAALGRQLVRPPTPRRFDSSVHRQLADGCWAVVAHGVPWATQAAVVTHLRASSVKWCAVAPRPARI